MWISSTTNWRDNDRVVLKLVSADDKAIKECYNYIGAPQNVFLIYALRVRNTNKERNDINKMEKMARINFN